MQFYLTHTLNSAKLKITNLNTMKFFIHLITILLILFAVGATVTVTLGTQDSKSKAANCEDNSYCEYGFKKQSNGSYMDKDGVIYNENGTVLMPTGDLVGPGTGGYGFLDSNRTYQVVSDPQDMFNTVHSPKKPIKAICDAELNCRTCNRFEAMACGHQIQLVAYNNGTHRKLPPGEYRRCSDSVIACNYVSELGSTKAVIDDTLIFDNNFTCTSLAVCFKSVLSIVSNWYDGIVNYKV